MTKKRLSPAERQERIQQAHATLVAEVERLTGSDEWLEYLRFMSRFPSRSARNNLLILAQCPSATAVLGYRQWQALGRHVRRGEHGIRIFAPLTRRIESDDPETGETEVGRLLRGFHLVPVFDVSMTEGDPLPTDQVRPRLVDGLAPVGMWELLAALVSDAGFILELVDTIEGHPGANGITNFSRRVVHVATEERPPAQQAKTLAHEVAHVRLHGDAKTPRPIAEVEAESVAFLVAESFGLDTSGYSIPYLAAWGSHDVATVLRVADRVQRCAAAILGLSARESAEEAA